MPEYGQFTFQILKITESTVFVPLVVIYFPFHSQLMIFW